MIWSPQIMQRRLQKFHNLPSRPVLRVLSSWQGQLGILRASRGGPLLSADDCLLSKAPYKGLVNNVVTAFVYHCYLTHWAKTQRRGPSHLPTQPPPWGTSGVFNPCCRLAEPGRCWAHVKASSQSALPIAFLKDSHVFNMYKAKEKQSWIL